MSTPERESKRKKFAWDLYHRYDTLVNEISARPGYIGGQEARIAAFVEVVHPWLHWDGMTATEDQILAELQAIRALLEEQSARPAIISGLPEIHLHAMGMTDTILADILKRAARAPSFRPTPKGEGE